MFYLLFKIFNNQCWHSFILSHQGTICIKNQYFVGKIRFFVFCRGHPRPFKEGEVLQQFQDFREKFWSKFWISIYILYIFTSPSAQDMDKSGSLGRLFLPNRPLGWPLVLKMSAKIFTQHANTCNVKTKTLWYKGAVPWKHDFFFYFTSLQLVLSAMWQLWNIFP